ncbi:MAG: helix-turn-helix domain-containing protein [Ruminococcus sp.]|nr:helix-turn-helix domain-containing protein [Ruminococcus sp.]
MIYKDKLKSIRESKGISQKELANHLKISPFTFSHYENEQDIIPSKYLDELVKYLNISIDYLFSLNNIEQYSKCNNVDCKKSGERLKEFRKENKLTQVKLAKILNIGNGTLSGYENGDYLIATPFLYDICKKYGISADYLLGKIDNPKYLK